MSARQSNSGVWGKQEMRYAAFMLGLVFLGAGNAGAQLSSSNYVLLPPPASWPTALLPEAPAAAPALFASSFMPTLTDAAGAISAPGPNLSSLSLLPAPDPKPQDVTSVFENYAWQAYVGYTYMRFFELPNVTKNTNGFNFGLVYYFKNHIGLDGEFQGTHLRQTGYGGWFLFGGGGARFRWSLPRNTEIWAHGLVGESHVTPQTANGPQHAFGYELGGGLDLNFKPRLALRVAADAMCTRYFSTYQFSPKASAGIVFKF